MAESAAEADMDGAEQDSSRAGPVREDFHIEPVTFLGR